MLQNCSLLQKLEGFNLATLLDLNMGYYNIELTQNASMFLMLYFEKGNMNILYH
jgi:hypothetical protein